MERPSNLLRLLPVLAILVGAILVGVPFLKATNPLELKLADLRFLLSGALREPDALAGHVVLVLMDPASERSFDAVVGSRWRRFHPRLIETLNAAGARVIAFDAEFADAEEQWDEELAAACRRAGNVYAGESGAGTALPLLAEAFAGVGSLRVRTFRDGLPRWISVRGGDSVPFSVMVADGYRSEAAAEPGFWINFFAPPGIFPAFSYSEVYAADADRLDNQLRTPLSVFKDKAVLIGMDLATGDRYAFPNTLGRRIPGVYGHAYAVETLLSGRRLKPAEPWQNALVLVGLLSALSLAVSSRFRWLRLGVSTAMLVGFLVAAVLLFALRDRWINASAFLVSFWVLLTFHWVYRRVSLTASLRRAVGFDPVLVESFRRESRRGGGQVQREVCILISDVQGYTRLVSQAEPARVATVMGEFLAGMERAIVAGGGYINKYVGDEIIAVFGFPLSGERREIRAVEVGLTMLAELESLKRSWTLRNLPLLEGIGVGVDAGPAVFAEVGGRTKSQFDIIGNCINGASRIEGLTRDHGRPMLISAEVRRGLSGAPQLLERFESLGLISVRGQGDREIFGLRKPAAKRGAP